MDGTAIPPEIWLYVVRALDELGSYNSFARTCQLFAALCRHEKRKAQARLVRERSEPYFCGGYRSGPCLAKGFWHGVVRTGGRGRDRGRELATEENWVEGELEGKCVTYLNGSIISTSNYHRGLLEGEMHCYRNGELSAIRHFASGDLEGPHYIYDEDGIDISYFEDGHREGWHFFRGAGMRYYQRGNMEGASFMWNANEPKASESATPYRAGFFENGMSYGFCEELDYRALRIVKYFVDGECEYWCIRYSPNGNVHSISYYEDGREWLAARCNGEQEHIVTSGGLVIPSY